MFHANTPSQLTESRFITDGGLETTLVFVNGIDLPDFAAFPLLDDDAGRSALAGYYDRYFDIAKRDDVGIVVDTPTWRANPDWGNRLGYDRDALAAVNRRSVGFVRELADRRPGLTALVDGVIGPRGDGYAIGELMTADESAAYHSLQVDAFRDASVDMISAITMTYLDEAVGVATASARAGVPVVISFTVETDGHLPSGQPLGDAIEATDAATDNAPAYYMINCAHPSHFERTLRDGGAWLSRIGAIRANASRMSHDELDNADELDRGDPRALALEYVELATLLPNLAVVGGCCGTDDEHVSEISAAFGSSRSAPG
jgi:S-methylmethionine-dependent homocysteine/selenocysteine methylase